MNKQPFLSAIVMACGKGRRFGGNKLTALLGGKALIRYTLDALPAHRFAQSAVIGLILVKFFNLQLRFIYHYISKHLYWTFLQISCRWNGAGTSVFPVPSHCLIIL